MSAKEELQERQKKYLRQWEAQQYNDSGDERDLQYVRSELSRMRKSLDLDRSVGEIALKIYKQAKDADLIRGRKIENIIAASLYVAVRQLNEGRSVGQIADYTTTDKKSITSTAQYLSSELGLEIDIARPTDYVDRFVGEFNKIRREKDRDPFGEEINELAYRILAEVEDRGMDSGKSPTGMAGAAIYLAGREEGYTGVRQADAANVARVSELTIRQRYQEQEEILNELRNQT